MNRSTPALQQPPAARNVQVDAHACGLPCVHARQLLGESRELLILFDDRQYRLRITAQGKLILTA
jgi:hemin uptake protein HemP